jgi:hypothetical protein
MYILLRYASPLTAAAHCLTCSVYILYVCIGNKYVTLYNEYNILKYCDV